MAAFGIEDSEFIRGKVPMTKAEIRAMVMVKAAIQDNDIVADIGAGTGSLTIEAALCAKSGKVFAIEKNPEGIQLIKQNAEKFGYRKYHCNRRQDAPDAMDGLPPLDVIIIGGTSGNMHKILDNAENLLKKGGRIVLTAVTAETTGEVVREFKDRPLEFEGFQMQINRLRKLGRYHLFRSAESSFYIYSN